MTGFDIAVLILVGVGAVIGFSRGFVQECVALFAWVFAVFAIHNLHTQLTMVLLAYVGTPSGAAVLAFAILLLVPYALMKLLANSLGSASRRSLLGPIDRVLGFGFGAIKGTLLVVMAFSLLVLGYDTVWGPDGRPDWITQARSYPFINASSDALVKMIGERRREAAAAATGPAASASASADKSAQ